MGLIADEGTVGEHVPPPLPLSSLHRALVQVATESVVHTGLQQLNIVTEQARFALTHTGGACGWVGV